MATQTKAENPKALTIGERLGCSKCGSEIEIIAPCTCQPPDQKFLCCGQPMGRMMGKSVHLGTE